MQPGRSCMQLGRSRMRCSLLYVAVIARLDRAIQ
jgi:hypothetical protein